MSGESVSGKSPLVMCLTNTVAANFTANVLLAIGAKPAMMEEPSEATELAAVADAVLVNVGTLTPAQADVMRAAVRACNLGSVPDKPGSVPWVLDPVACQVVSYRRTFVNELLLQKPTVLRGNADEINFLLGSVPDLMGSVPTLATGAVDMIRRGTEEVERVTGGVPILQQVTATGCAQGAVVAAFLGWGQTPVEALLSASRLMKRAGERAWEKAKRPGSFQIALLDALSELAPSFSKRQLQSTGRDGLQPVCGRAGARPSQLRHEALKLPQDPLRLSSTDLPDLHA